MSYAGSAPEAGIVPADGNEGSAVYEYVVTDGTDEWELHLQCWAKVDGSGVYVAWELPEAGVDGWYGVLEDETRFEDDRHRVLLSRPRYGDHPDLDAGVLALPGSGRDGGTWLDDVDTADFSRAYWQVQTYFQSPTYRVESLDWRPDRYLAPENADAGDAFELELRGYDREHVLLGQFWRWPDAPAVHLAWKTGARTSTRGTLSSGVNAKTGGYESTAPSFYGFYTTEDEHKDALRESYLGVRHEVGDREPLTVVEGPTLSATDE